MLNKMVNTKIHEDAKRNALIFFSSLADETRLKILLSIANEKKNVGEIYDYVGRNNMTLSAISHQLKNLFDLGIVTSKKEGQEKYFELSENYCWCILRDVFKQFNDNIKIKCKKCENKGVKYGLLRNSRK